MIVKLLTEHHLEFLSFKGGCTDSFESTLVKIPHCWKSHALAQMVFFSGSTLTEKTTTTSFMKTISESKGPVGPDPAPRL